MQLRARWLVAAAACVLLLILPAPAWQDAQPAAQVFDVTEKSIAELQDAMSRGEVTSRQLVEGHIARIAAYDQAGPALNAFVALNPRALETADALDRERRERGPRGRLHGIPVVVKDNFDTADMPTTGSSIALATNRPARDAYQVERLREAGAVIIGKTNLHELAAGIVTVSSLGGQTRNPYDPTRNPGGSSGGTGAAVAASFAAAGLGTDTCGSIRIPAAHNNLVGLRPTMGLSSRAGVIPLALTQDVAGPLARSVADLAVMLDATVGYDPRDSATEAGRGHIPESYVTALEGATLRGVRVGVLAELFGDTDADAEVANLVRGALGRLRASGAVTVDVLVPDFAERLRGTSVIDYEFKFQLANYLAAQPAPAVRSLGEILERGLHHEALTGTFRRRNAVESRDSDAYRAALARRDELRRVVLEAMDEHRVVALVYPVLRRKAAPIGESQSGSTCQLAASTALPALSMPAAFTDDGLPVGMELLGRPFSEVDLLRIGRAFEQVAAFRRPPPTTPPVPDVRAAPSRLVVGDEPPPIPDEQPALEVSVRWDEPRGVLVFSARALAVAQPDVIVAVLRQGPNGPVIGRLLHPQRITGAGEIPLSEENRKRFDAGELLAQLFTRASPLGGPSAPVAPR